MQQMNISNLLFWMIKEGKRELIQGCLGDVVDYRD